MKEILIFAACLLLGTTESANASSDHPAPKRHVSKAAKCHEVKVSKARLQFYFTEYRALETELGV